ncbi:MAG TPA: hypothetical protein VNZ86_07095, partial [Bacteroidia bacterium]|nr:hypothetical protein [Bacteroidia bacterium]
QATHKRAILLGFIGALMTLVRPTMIILFLFPLLYRVRDRKTLQDKMNFLWSSRNQLRLLIITFVLTGLPQFIYWKYTSGNWLFFSYAGERFFWTNPHLYEGLFGYRKGWFRYTPLMLLAVAGIIPLIRSFRDFFLGAILPVLLLGYALLCWWCWWYGGSFGTRAFIDFYPLLAFPLAAFFHFISTRNTRIQDVALFLTGILVVFNLFQTWQYAKGLIHFDSMTEEAYYRALGQTMPSTQYWECLKAPNYDAAFKGLDESVLAMDSYEPDSIPEVFKSHLDYTLHHTGLSSLALQNGFTTTPELSFPVGGLMDMRDWKIKITVYVHMPVSFPGVDQDKAQFNLSMVTPKGEILWAQHIVLADVCHKGEWTAVNTQLELFPNSVREAYLIMNVTNASAVPICVDDLRMDALQPPPAKQE